jgi:hypothetical protein
MNENGKPLNPLIVTGAAPDVLIDIAQVPRVCSYDFMAIGMDAVDRYRWPIRWCATYHPVEIPEIRRRREAIGGNADFKIISHERRDDVDIFIADWWQPSGSSSLLGVQTAIRLGYTRIILAGCPLIGKNAQNGSYENFRKGWEARAFDLGDRVRSMSGWTLDFLGAPTEEWLLKGSTQ